MANLTVDVRLDAEEVTAALRHDAVAGLLATPRWLSPKWLYDARGSDLFEQITRLPEYYPTRAEREILLEHGTAIAELTGARTLVELGGGMSDKTQLLLHELRRSGRLGRFVPVDISESALRSAGRVVDADHPGVEVSGVVGDFTAHLGELPGAADGPRLIAFLGGTVGNLLPAERASLLAQLRSALAPGEWFLLGTDLVKEPELIRRAYDDEAGVTAAFNRNVLTVLNRELDADFVPAAYDHVARWNAEAEWIEMRLRSRHAQTVRLDAVDVDLRLADGEELRTEISAKFRPDGVRRELIGAGFEPVEWWTDTLDRFGVSLSRAA